MNIFIFSNQNKKHKDNIQKNNLHCSPSFVNVTSNYTMSTYNSHNIVKFCTKNKERKLIKYILNQVKETSLHKVIILLEKKKTTYDYCT